MTNDDDTLNSSVTDSNCSQFEFCTIQYFRYIERLKNKISSRNFPENKNLAEKFLSHLLINRNSNQF